MSRVLGRGPVVLAALATAGAVLVLAGRPWLRADLTGLLTGTPEATVAGAEAAPLVPAVALVALAAAAAVSIAGRIARVLAGSAIVLAGVAAAAGAVDVLREPGPSAASALAPVTAGGTLAADAVTTTVWPALTAAAGLLLAGCGAAALLAGRRWAGGRRFEAAPRGGARSSPTEPVSDWDALSRGEDPTARDAGRRP